MGLKLEVATLEDVPEAQRALYREASGKYVLDAEGIEDLFGAKSKLGEFRDNNIRLMKTLEEAKKTTGLSEADKAELERLKAVEQDFKGKQTISVAKMDELVAERTRRLNEEFAAKLDTEAKAAAEFRTRYERERVGNVLRNEALKAGVLPEALDDVMNRGDRVFKLHEDDVMAFDSKGEPLYGKDGSLLKVSEWFDGLATSAKFLFAPNSGSSAEGSKKINGKVDYESMTSTQRIAHGLRDAGYK